MEYISSNVVVEFIKGETDTQDKYRFIFTKKCRIIGNSKWYRGQVYFNKQLADDEMSREYYEKNPLKWCDLNPSARITLYTDDGEGSQHDAGVKLAAESPRYYQFHVLYGTRTQRFDPKDYNHSEIEYTYEVPITHWGSYINRSISFFGEDTSVKLKFNSSYTSVAEQQRVAREFIDGMEFYEKKLSEAPTVCRDKFRYNHSVKNDGSIEISVTLPKSRLQTYIISWTPSVYFGPHAEKTNITEDTAELTLQ